MRHVNSRVEMLKRKAQIFLLLTILAISFITGITTILLETQRARYDDPNPASQLFTQTWKNTVESVQDILELGMVQHSQFLDTTYDLNTTIASSFHALQAYLVTKGYSASIQTLSQYILTNTTTTGQTFTLSNYQVKIHLATTTTELDQTILFTIIYDAVVNATGNTVTITKTVNGQTQYLSGASFTITGVTDLGNGVYSYTTAGATNATTTAGMLFTALNLA